MCSIWLPPESECQELSMLANYRKMVLVTIASENGNRQLMQLQNPQTTMQCWKTGATNISIKLRPVATWSNWFCFVTSAQIRGQLREAANIQNGGLTFHLKKIHRNICLLPVLQSSGM